MIGLARQSEAKAGSNVILKTRSRRRAVEVQLAFDLTPIRVARPFCPPSTLETEGQHDDNTEQPRDGA